MWALPQAWNLRPLELLMINLFNKMFMQQPLVGLDNAPVIKFEDEHQRELFLDVLAILFVKQITYSYADLRRFHSENWATNKLHRTNGILYMHGAMLSEFAAVVDLLEKYKFIIRRPSPFYGDDTNADSIRFNVDSTTAKDSALTLYTELLRRTYNKMVSVLSDPGPAEPIMHDFMAQYGKFRAMLVSDDSRKAEFKESILFMGALQLKQTQINDLFVRISIITEDVLFYENLLAFAGIKIVPTPEFRNKLIQFKLSKEI